MRLLQTFVFAVAATVTAAAQDTPPTNPAAPQASPTRPPNAPGRDVAIIQVKTLTGDSFNRLVRLLGVFNTQINSDEKLRTIVVYSQPDTIEKIRKVVDQLDRPGSEAAIGRNIDATLTLLRCSMTAAAEPKPLPADMESVARQLRASTAYKNIEVWETFPLHLQEGKVSDETVKLGPKQASGFVVFTLHPESVTRRDSGRSVRFEQFKIRFSFPGTGELGFTTSGDFLDSQKTVLGKVSGFDDDTAVFVVVSLKVLD